MYKQIFKMIYAADDAEYEALQQEAMTELEGMGLSQVVEWYDTRMKEIRTDLDGLIDDAVKAYTAN